MNKTHIVAIIALIIIGAIFVCVGYRGSQNPLVNLDTSNNIGTVPERANLTGEYVCLMRMVNSGTSTTTITATNSANEDVCKPGLKTDMGIYYALDFNLASQIRPELKVGDLLEASGIVTPIEMLSSDIWQQYSLKGIFSVTDSVRKLNEKPIAYLCNGDGMMCWDGSTVGRTGTDCQFAACPATNITSTKIQTTLGQPMTGLNITVTPKKIVSDSRCPQDVQCIQAGTVEVQTVIASKVAHGEHVLKLNKSQVFGDFTVTLIDVSPVPKAGEKIADSSYRFTFEVVKN